MNKHALKALLAVILAALVGAIPIAWGAVPARAQANYDVVILVVDDFGSVDVSAVDPAQFDSGDSCALSLEGQAYAVRGVSADPIEQPHGELVYAELEELLDTLGAGSSVSLAQVDIQGVTTETAADRIATAIDSHNADVYVINMSFAIIPCEYIQAFADFGSQLLDARVARDLNRYRGLFQRAVVFYDQTVFPVMSQHAQQTQNLDPLQDLFASLGNRAVPVAAAGNFGLDFPFWPGAWNQVVSVSAGGGTDLYTTTPWDKKSEMPLLAGDVAQPGKAKRVSNYGEVMLPGEFAGDFGEAAGTSFAAPRLSALTALYLSGVGTGHCQNASGGPGLAYGDWDNLTLPQAIQQHCPDMLAYLP